MIKLLYSSRMECVDQFGGLIVDFIRLIYFTIGFLCLNTLINGEKVVSGFICRRFD